MKHVRPVRIIRNKHKLRVPHSVRSKISLTLGVEIPHFMVSSEEEKRNIKSENIDLNRLVYDNRERLKELAALNATATILKKNRPIHETLYEVCRI